MKLVDSSGWLEYLTDGPLAEAYAPHLQDLSELLTPSVVVFEVYKWIKRQRSEEEALVAVAQLEKTKVVPLATSIALTAADLSLEHGLAMADSLIYATAVLHQVALVTSDRDFASLPGVIYMEK